MVIGKDTTQHPLPKDRTVNVTIDGNPVKQVTQFTYLGATIKSDGKIDKEINVRIGKATGAFNQLNNVWKNKNISISNKVKIYVAAVLTILTYGCEVWSTTQVQMGRLETFHHYCLRRIIRVRWFHRVRNEEVLNRASVLPIKQIIGSKTLRWFGHTLVGWQTIVFLTIDSTGNHSIGSGLEVDQGKISMMFTLKMLWRNGIGLELRLII